MKVIPPLAITDSMLTSSTVAEPFAPSAYAGGTTYALGAIVSVSADFAAYISLAAGNIGHTPNVSPLWWKKIGVTETAYNAGTTYAKGDTCSLAVTHRCYESLQAANTGNTPNAAASAAWWLDVGPTNKWAVFDSLRNTQTFQSTSPLTIVITPGFRVDSLALLGLNATSVTLSETSTAGGGTVFNHTESLSSRITTDWYDYFFKEFEYRPSYIAFDIPPFADGIITVSVTNSAGAAACGACILGSAQYIGAVQYNAESDAVNYSTITRDDFGNVTLIPRRSIPKTTQTLLCSKSLIDIVRALRDALNATPAVWSGLDDDATQDYYESLLILGIYRRFTINLAYEDNAMISLELEEI